MIKRFLLGFLLVVSGIFLFVNIKNHKIEIVNREDLAVYVNDELVSSIPKKGEAIFIKAVCDNDGKASWDNENWGLLVTNMSKKTKCNLYFYEGQTVFNFDYTGGEQVFTAPVSGIYKLETWGAQGGNATETYRGGYGGYSQGTVFLNKSEKIYLNVGGEGENGGFEASAISLGGYNGGGSGKNNAYNSKCTTGGGGATHIATKSGLLSSLEMYKNNILIVSGGGGGSYYHVGTNNQWYYIKSYGDGGGFIGNKGISSWGEHCEECYSSGGTTNSSGTDGLYISSFGIGASGVDEAAGGGGGFYGGNSNYGSGGGGSGYIGNPLLKDRVMYCYNCEESSDESTKTISTTCNEETPTENCAKKGNGYARITFIGNP